MKKQPRFTPLGLVPTQEQVAIQCSQQRISLIEANAGAAKTTTLALRIAEALSYGLSPEKIVALVFTPEARDVLRQRLVDIGVNPRLVARLALHTVDDFSRLALSYWEERRTPYLNSWYELKPFALEALATLSDYAQTKSLELDIRSDHLALRYFFERQLQIKSAMLLQLDEGESAEEKAWTHQLPLSEYLWVQHYERLRKSLYGSALFRGPHDATYDLACTLEQQPELLQLLPEYRLVIVDELHDANEASFQILRVLLANPNTYLVAAGDKHQVIDTLRAADSSYLYDRFASYFGGLKTFPLRFSFRHGPYLAYAARMLKSNKADSLVAIDTKINSYSYDHQQPMQGAEAVVQALLNWQKDNKQPLEQCAILLRDTHQSLYIENALIMAQIPYQLQGMMGYLQRDEILFLRVLLAVATADFAAIKSEVVRRKMLRTLVLYTEVQMDDEHLQAAIDEIIEQPALLNGFYQHIVKRSESAVTVQRFESLLSYAQQATKQSAEQVLQQMCEQIDLAQIAKRIYIHDYEASVIHKSIAAFIAVAKHTGLDATAFALWCAEHDQFVLRPETTGVVLTTVAQSKGKEYAHVILPYLEQHEFPSLLLPERVESNLFYVAITRAQQCLSLCVPTVKHMVSQYVAALRLDELRPHAEKRLAQLIAYQRSGQGFNPPAVAKPQAAPKKAVQQDSSGRVDLRVPYAEKDEAKALGARWDPVKKVWYAPAGADAASFARWH